MSASRLLVVDDEPIREELATVLRAQGYAVDVADGVAAALRRLSDFDYDVVLVDMEMPNPQHPTAPGMLDRTAGLVVLRKVMESAFHEIALVLTGHGSRSNRIEALQLGAVDYLDKADFVTNRDLVRNAIERAAVRRKQASGDAEVYAELKRGRLQQFDQKPPPLDLGPFERGLSVAGFNIPAQYLSGDGFDFHWSPERRRLVFLLFDVMGKGTGGAMIADKVESTFRRAMQDNASLLALDGLFQEALTSARCGDRYVTGIVGELDVADQTLHLLNSGHPWPSFAPTPEAFSKDARGPRWVATDPTRGTPPLVSVAFGPGSSVVLYSDGVSERMDSDADGAAAFSDEGIRRAHRNAAAPNALDLCAEVLGESLDFGRRVAALKDDLTVVAIHWRAGVSLLS